MGFEFSFLLVLDFIVPLFIQGNQINRFSLLVERYWFLSFLRILSNHFFLLQNWFYSHLLSGFLINVLFWYFFLFLTHFIKRLSHLFKRIIEQHLGLFELLTIHFKMVILFCRYLLLLLLLSPLEERGYFVFLANTIHNGAKAGFKLASHQTTILYYRVNNNQMTCQINLLLRNTHSNS